MAGKGRKKNARRTPQPSGPSLSVCLIVKDAEDRIEKWVSSARRWADDIVVVDTGSNDETRKRAADSGARVFDFEWGDDFSAARNHGLAQASGDWVLILDVDELLARRDRKPLLKALRRSGVDAYRLPTRNYTNRTHAAGWRACSRDYPDEEAEASGWFPTYKVRLFRRKPEHRFQGRVHEMAEDSILASGGLRTCRFPSITTGPWESKTRRRRGFIFGSESSRSATTPGTPGPGSSSAFRRSPSTRLNAPERCSRKRWID